MLQDAADWITFITDQLGNLYVMEAQDFAESVVAGWCIYRAKIFKDRLLEIQAGNGSRQKKAQLVFKGGKANVTIDL